MMDKESCIRRATEADVSRIIEIFVFNDRVNYLPIFKDEAYAFGTLQVVPMAEALLRDPARLAEIAVYDDSLVRGFVWVQGDELKKLYVDTFFQGRGIGAELLQYAVAERGARFLWALEKNTRARTFYNRHGFTESGRRMHEDDTTEYIVELRLPSAE